MGYSSSYWNRLSGRQSEASSWGWYTEPSCQNFYYLLLAMLQWKSYHSNGHGRRQQEQHHFFIPPEPLAHHKQLPLRCPLFWDKTLWVGLQGVWTQEFMFWTYLNSFIFFICDPGAQMFQTFLIFNFPHPSSPPWFCCRGISFCSDILIFRDNHSFWGAVILNCPKLSLV